MDSLPNKPSRRARYNPAAVPPASLAPRRERNQSKSGRKPQAPGCEPQPSVYVPRHFSARAVPVPGPGRAHYALTEQAGEPSEAHVLSSTFIPLFPTQWSLLLLLTVPSLPTALEPSQGPLKYQDRLARPKTFIFSF